MKRPDKCCADGCGKPTRSHNVAVDMSEHDAIGLPTLAGVVCHTCWIGETDGVPEIGELLNDHDDLWEAVSSEYMIATAISVEGLTR